MGIKKLFTLIILLTLNFNSIQAIEPDVFVQSTVNRASQILSNSISKQEKMDQLEIIAMETVDITGIGFYSLGSKRKELDGNQRKEYSKLFEGYFLIKLVMLYLQLIEQKHQVL